MGCWVHSTATILMLIKNHNGIHLEGVPFVLDASRPVACAFASHAHADHCAHHQKTLCTAPTAALARRRFRGGEFTELPYGVSTTFAGTDLELHPSGHVLGGAQILMRVGGSRILFSGDLKPAGGKSSPPAATPACDVLILETTYGQPAYQFPPTEIVVANLVTLIKRVLVRGFTPVLLAYALGKAQEAIALLDGEGFAFACQRNVYAMCRIYEQFGISLSGIERFNGDNLRDKVVVIPPGRGYREWQQISNPYRIFLSGWALDGHNRNHRSRAEAMVPLSDHADYTQLLAFVEATGAQTVITHHGFPEFAQELRRRGLNAFHLVGKKPVDIRTGCAAGAGTTYDLFTQQSS